MTSKLGLIYHYFKVVPVVIHFLPSCPTKKTVVLQKKQLSYTFNIQIKAQDIIVLIFFQLSYNDPVVLHIMTSKLGLNMSFYKVVPVVLQFLHHFPVVLQKNQLSYKNPSCPTKTQLSYTFDIKIKAQDVIVLILFQLSYNDPVVLHL